MSDDAVLAVIDALEALGVDYMLVGSFSSNLYGIPRSTKDADFVVQFKDSSISALAMRLGPSFQLDPQASFEMISATTMHVLRYVGTPFSVELFLLSSDPHDLARFERRRAESMLGRNVFVPSVEDVIITKLRWLGSIRRPKDREDIRSILAVQRPNIDWNYVHSWCDQHGTRPLLEEIIQTLPEV